ncbi:MAG TPA: hypothetical protein VM409_00720 [Chloroflexia bacterium]|nr:hypothetical protein [Chloroflexia bacterium]
MKTFAPAITLLAFVAAIATGCTTGNGSQDGIEAPTPVAATPASTVPLATTAASTLTPSQQPESDQQIGSAQVDSIDILMLESFPVQVSVTVKGNLPDACTTLGTISRTRNGNTFNVNVATTRPRSAMCAQMIVPFEETLALDVAGLKAGTYTVNVNGVSKTFTLNADNQ